MLIRNATVDDLDEVSSVEAQCFPRSGSSNSRGVLTETEILSSNGRFGVITSMNMNVSFGEFKTGTHEFFQTKNSAAMRN